MHNCICSSADCSSFCTQARAVHRNITAYVSYGLCCLIVKIPTVLWRASGGGSESCVWKLEVQKKH